MHCAFAMKLRSPQMDCGSDGPAAAGCGAGAAATAGAGSGAPGCDGAAGAGLRDLAAADGGFGVAMAGVAGAAAASAASAAAGGSVGGNASGAASEAGDAGTGATAGAATGTGGRRCFGLFVRRAFSVAVPAGDDHEQPHGQQHQPKQDAAHARRLVAHFRAGRARRPRPRSLLGPGLARRRRRPLGAARADDDGFFIGQRSGMRVGGLRSDRQAAVEKPAGNGGCAQLRGRRGGPFALRPAFRARGRRHRRRCRRRQLSAATPAEIRALAVLRAAHRTDQGHDD